MTVLSILGRTVVVAAVAGVVGCTAAKTEPGVDSGTNSNAALVTWHDGKPAYAIACGAPGGCLERANAMCRDTFGNYTTLQSVNMPTAGSAREPLGPPSVVIRCG
ncbi:MAG: hypothetical protein JSR90_22110 [Proteobacteria bacterium]|nr:hypothetical protein [Pseudomonadota bacterium]